MELSKNYKQLNNELIVSLRNYEKGNSMHEYYLNKIITINEPLIRAKAKPYLERDDYEDILQEMRMNLLSAIESFDTNKDVSFSTWAGYYLELTTLRFINSNKLVKPCGYHITKILNARKKLLNSGIINPTIEQIAQASGLSVIDVEYPLNSIANGGIVSIDKNIFNVGDSEKYKFIDLFTSDVDIAQEYNRKELIEFINLAINYLPNSQRVAVQQKYFEDKSQAEIGKLLNVSQVQACNILKVAHNNLKILLREDNFSLLRLSEKLILDRNKNPKLDTDKFINNNKITSSVLLKLSNLILFTNSKALLAKYTPVNINEPQNYNQSEMIKVTEIVTKQQKLDNKQINYLKSFNNTSQERTY